MGVLRKTVVLDAGYATILEHMERASRSPDPIMACYGRLGAQLAVPALQAIDAERQTGTDASSLHCGLISIWTSVLATVAGTIVAPAERAAFLRALGDDLHDALHQSADGEIADERPARPQ